MKLLVNGNEINVNKTEWKDGNLSLSVDGTAYTFSETELKKMVKGIAPDNKNGHVIIQGQDLLISPMTKKNRAHGTEAGAMISPMPGKIFKVIKAVGDKVNKGDTILIMEAMKMEHPVKASYDGVIGEIFYNEGQQVDGGVELVTVKETKE